MLGNTKFVISFRFVQLKNKKKNESNAIISEDLFFKRKKNNIYPHNAYRYFILIGVNFSQQDALKKESLNQLQKRKTRAGSVRRATSLFTV